MTEKPQEDTHQIELIAKEMLFRFRGKPRKWRDWHLPSIRERRKVCLRALKKYLKVNGEHEWEATILANHFELLKKEPLEIQELYLQVFSLLSYAAFRVQGPRWFSDFISNPILFDGDDTLFFRQIATHNFCLRNEFAKYGLDWEQWTEYPPANIIIESNRSSQWDQLTKEMDLLMELSDVSKSDSFWSSLKKDCMALKKRKKEFLEGRLALPESDWFILHASDWKTFFPTVFKSWKYLCGKDNCAGEDLAYFLKCSLEADPIIKGIAEISKSQVRNFTIKVWDRKDLNDILMGNFVGDCLSVGEKDVYPAVRLPGVPGRRRPAGILDFLVDMGVQLIEIFEKKDEKEYPAGLCYLFVFLDNGKPVLMVDSMELRPYFQNRRWLNSEIRNALFNFLKGYARAVGIERVVLGDLGPVLKSGKNKGMRHEIQSDIKTFDLQAISFEKIEKLGGYWNHRPYFLESVGGTEAYVIV